MRPEKVIEHLSSDISSGGFFPDIDHPLIFICMFSSNFSVFSMRSRASCSVFKLLRISSTYLDLDNNSTTLGKSSLTISQNFLIASSDCPPLEHTPKMAETITALMSFP